MSSYPSRWHAGNPLRSLPGCTYRRLQCLLPITGKQRGNKEPDSLTEYDGCLQICHHSLMVYELHWMSKITLDIWASDCADSSIVRCIPYPTKSSSWGLGLSRSDILYRRIAPSLLDDCFMSRPWPFPVPFIVIYDYISLLLLFKLTRVGFTSCAT